MIVRLLKSIGVGTCIKAVTKHFGKYSSGRCPLTANPYRRALFGALLGGIFAVVLAGAMKSSGEENRVKADRPTNQTKTSLASKPALSNVLVHVNNAKDFDRYVLNASKPCIADFYSDHCKPCRMLAPTMEQLAAKYESRAVVCKVNLDLAPNLAGAYKIRGIPAVLFFSGGKEVHRLIGLRRQADYEDVLKRILKK